MNCVKIVLLILLLNIGVLCAYNIKLSKIDLKSYGNLFDIDSKRKSIAILGLKSQSFGVDQEAVIDFFDGDQWNSIPPVIKTDTGDKQILIQNQSKIRFDSLGNVWVSGKSLYKYTGSTWQEFFIDDSLKSYRRFSMFCIDRNNNIWATTNVYNYSQVPWISYSEIIKFDGKKFEVKFRSDNYFRFGNFCPNVFGSSITALPDGRIFVQNRYTTQDTAYSLFIYENDTLVKSSLQPPTKENWLSHSVAQIYPDNEGNIWFCYDFIYYDLPDAIGFECCTGLSRLNGDNWFLYSRSDGLPMVTLTNYSIPILGITKLSNGNYWVLTIRGIYELNGNNKLSPIKWPSIYNNSEFFRKNISMKDADVYEYLDHQIFISDTIPNSYRMSKVITGYDDIVWILGQWGLLKVDSKLSSISTNEQIDNDLNLFPNPSYSGHGITLQIPENISGIKISLYNSLGSLLDTHTESDVSPGQRTINYKPAVELSSGTYWIRVEAFPSGSLGTRESWCKPVVIITNY